MALRVWLETAAPPVFGKEIEEVKKPIPLTRVSVFLFDKSTNNSNIPEY